MAEGSFECTSTDNKRGGEGRVVSRRVKVAVSPSSKVVVVVVVEFVVSVFVVICVRSKHEKCVKSEVLVAEIVVKAQKSGQTSNSKN